MIKGILKIIDLNKLENKMASKEDIKGIDRKEDLVRMENEMASKEDL